MVSEILNQLADACGEVMDLLAFPLPVWVIGELLGVPVEDSGSDDLIGVRDGSDRLSEDELVATIVLLFAAGFATTTNFIGNGLVSLFRNPDQMRMLRDDPTLGHSVVDEMLPCESSVQLDARTALEDADIAGNRSDAGQVVLTLLGAAKPRPQPRLDQTGL